MAAALTATFDATTGGVFLSATEIALPSSVGTVAFERSADGGDWELIEERVAVLGFAQFSDYLFPPDVPLEYRVRYTPIGHVVGVGAAVNGNGTALNPPLPTEAIAGTDWLLVVSACRNTAITPVVSGGLGGGYSSHSGSYSLNLSSKVKDVGEPTPTVSFPGAVAGDSTSARVVAIRGVLGPDNIVNLDTVAGTTTIPFNGITPPGGVGSFAVVAGWAADDWSNTPGANTWTTVFEQSTTLGNDQGIVLISKVATVSPVPAGTISATRASSISKSLTMTYAEMAEQLVTAAALTPDVAGTLLVTTGLESTASPTYATYVEVVGWSDVQRSDRATLIPISGSNRPVAVSDAAGPRRWEVTLRFDDRVAADEVDAVLAEGQPIYLRAPVEAPFPLGWHAVGARTMDRRSARGVRRYLVLELTECEAPAVA